MKNGTITEQIKSSGTVHEYKPMKIFNLTKILILLLILKIEVWTYNLMVSNIFIEKHNFFGKKQDRKYYFLTLYSDLLSTGG